MLRLDAPRSVGPPWKRFALRFNHMSPLLPSTSEAHVTVRRRCSRSAGNFRLRLDADLAFPPSRLPPPETAWAAKQGSVFESPGAESRGFVFPRPFDHHFGRDIKNFFLRPEPGGRTRRLCPLRRAKTLSRGPRARRQTTSAHARNGHLTGTSAIPNMSTESPRRRPPACGRAPAYRGIRRFQHVRGGASHTFR